MDLSFCRADCQCKLGKQKSSSFSLLLVEKVWKEMVSCGEDALQQTGFENQSHRLNSQCGYKWRWIPVSGSADCSSSSKLRCFLAPAVYKRRAPQHHAVLYPSKSIMALLPAGAAGNTAAVQRSLWVVRREKIPRRRGKRLLRWVSRLPPWPALCATQSVFPRLLSAFFLPGDNQKLVEHSEMALDTAEQVLPACEQGGWDSSRSK